MFAIICKMLDINKRYLLNVLKTTTPAKTQILNTADTLGFNISFSFKNLNIAYEGFDLNDDKKICPNPGAKINRLIGVFDILSARSKGCISIDNTYCHYIENNKLISCGMQALIEVFPNVKFFQIGPNYSGRPERVVGFYEKDSNIFQVCLIDLHHKVYPSK